MREILFRGKRVDNGEWVYGDLINTPELKTRIIWYEDTSSDGVDYFKGFNYLVDKNTIGQFTGLLDKNGNKIFEGHIDKSGMVVIFHNNAFQLCSLVEREVVQAIPFWYCDNKIFDEIEIIGNIHEKK